MPEAYSLDERACIRVAKGLTGRWKAYLRRCAWRWSRVNDGQYREDRRENGFTVAGILEERHLEVGLFDGDSMRCMIGL